MDEHGGIVEFAERSAKDSFTLFIGDFSSAALLAVSSIIIARLLGPEGYGIYSISFAAPALIISLIGLGLDSAAIRFPAKYIAEGHVSSVPHFIRTIVFFRFLIGLSASLLCLTLSDFMAATLLNRPSVTPYIRLLSALVLFETLFSLIYGLFIGLNSASGASTVKVLMAAFKGAAAPILVILGFGVYGALFGHMLGYIIPSLVGLLMLYMRYYRRLNFRPEGDRGPAEDSHLRAILRFSLPLYFSSLVALLFGNYQAILLARYASDSEVGCFRAAVNLSTIITVVVSPIITALFPTFSRLNSSGLKERIGDFLNLSVKYSSLVIVPLSALLACISNYLVDVVYGSGYIQAGSYLALYSAIYMLVGLGSGIFISLFNGLGETGLTLRVNLIGFVVFAAISPLLAGAYRVYGIIISLLTSNIISTLYAYSLAWRRLGVRLNFSASARIYVSSATSAAPTAIIVYCMKLPSIIGLVVCSIAYAAAYMTAAPILRALSWEDLRNLERIFGGIRPLKSLFRIIAVYMGRLMDLA